MENGFLDNFVLPDGAAEAIKRAGISSKKLGDGVEFFNLGHDQGVAFRFFVHQLRNEAKSKIAKISIPDSIEMIEWMPDRFNHPTEQVRFLPVELLEFDEGDENGKNKSCIGGKYKAAYDSWKLGLNAPGLSLDKWGVLDDGQVFTLKEMRIYSVEQFAAQPRSKIDRLPKEFISAFEQAIEYVNGKVGRDMTAHAAEQVLSLQQENAKMREEMKAMQDQVKELLLGAKALKKKPAKKTKTVVVDGEIKDLEDGN